MVPVGSSGSALMTCAMKLWVRTLANLENKATCRFFQGLARFQFPAERSDGGLPEGFVRLLDYVLVCVRAIVKCCGNLKDLASAFELEGIHFIR